MPQSYKASVKPQHERKEYIAAQTSVGTYTSYDVYEGKPTHLPIVRLPLTLPLYRMANGRTQSHQLGYIAANELPADYFSKGQENDSVQQIQHDILRKFAQEETESVTSIIDELARTRQTEPLLITPAGVVVNGNRRLAAMRELYFSDRQADFPTFADVECAVLPALSDDQVEDIEIRLQMRPETKLPYGWIDECLKIQKQMDTGRKEEEIARLMRKKPGDLRKALSALKYAEIYLRDWVKKPRDYRVVEAGEQFFNDLVTRLRAKDGELLEANMRMAWILFDNRMSLGSRIYDFNRILGDKAAEVLTKLAERIEIDLAPALPSGDTLDPLDVDLGEMGESSGAYGALISVLDDPEQREEIADQLRAVCQTIIDAGRTAKEGRSALGAVQDANTRLTEVDLTKADPKTYEGIGKQLEEIIRRATDLKNKLRSYKTGPGQPPTSDEGAT
jgi:hypothetical protein